MEENTELKTFLLEGATRLKAFCDKHNVTITPYQTPSETALRAMFSLCQNDPVLNEMCIAGNIDRDDPDQLEALYRGFREGAIMQDFTSFMKHAVSEIKAYRKKHKKGFHSFDFRRNPDNLHASILNMK